MGTELDQKIISQVEYYFGNANLMRDEFLQKEIKKDDGWVPMEAMLAFPRLADLSSEGSVIADALRKSESGLLEVSEDGSKIRRIRPVQEVTEDLKKEVALRTVYCKGFEKTATLDDLLEFFKEYPTVTNVTMLYFFGKSDPQFNGSALVQFENREQAERFICGVAEFRGVLLFKKWYEEWKQYKEERFKMQDETGSILLVTGLGEDCNWTDVKDTFSKLLDKVDIRFVEIEKEDGNVQAYLKLSSAKVAKQLKEKAGDVVKIKDSEGTVSILEGDAEQEFIKRAAARRVEFLKRRERGGKRSRGGHRGRRGGF